MTQKRMIHTSIWASEQVAKLSRPARLLYIGLITYADDDGRLKGNPSLLRSQIFPYDEDILIKDVKTWLQEILDLKLIIAYLINEESYLYHPNWTEYQILRADRRKESHIPAPLGQPTGNQVSTECPLKLSKDKVSKDKVIYMTDLFNKFYKEYPNKKAKKKAREVWLKIEIDDNKFKEIMDSLEKAKKSSQWQKDNGQFIPHPSTWLNQERWNDEVEVPVIKTIKKY